MTDLLAIHESVGLLTVQDGNVVISPDISAQIAAFESQVKLVTDKEKALKQAIFEEMERHGCIKIDTDDLLINYIPETERESLDTKALKEECPEVYDTYCKLSPVNATLRMKVR